MNCSIVYSINIHEKPDFLLYQISNIDKYTKSSYIIILNCNNFMYKTLKENDIIKKNKKIIINSEYFDKKPYTGLLFKGIYKNLQYALDNINYNYFIILSSRNLFHKELDIEKLDNLFMLKLKKINSNNYKKTHSKLKYENIDRWWWPSIKQLKISKYFKEQNADFYNSEHEGLIINWKTCYKINKFFEDKKMFLIELFNTNICIEEFIIQTLSFYTGNIFINIGNGIKTQKKKDKKKGYVYKTIRNINLIESFVNYSSQKSNNNYLLKIKIFLLIVLIIILFYFNINININ